jgi:hypothetical protein
LPFLNISPDDIGPRRTRATLAYIEGVMLWPDDPEKRQHALKAAGLETVGAMIANHAGESIMAADLVSLWADARATRPLADIQEEARKAFVHGFAAGLVLCEVIGRRDRKHPRAQLGDTQRAVGKMFSGAGGYPMSQKTIEMTIWPQFRKVAPLWASVVYGNQARGEGPGETRFPCRLGEIEHFFAVAEWYRKAGEQCRTKGATRQLLLAAETWRVPAGTAHMLPCPEMQVFRLKKLP